MYLVGFIVYVLLCGALAWAIAVMITRRAKRRSTRWIAAAFLLPIALALPLADEIIGKYQFERLCKEAKDVKIYGTILVGEDLYTSDGKWRLANRGEDGYRLRKELRLYLRQAEAPPRDVPAVIPVQLYERKIYDARSGALLAEWLQYSTQGGWISRAFGSPGDKILVRQQCMPEMVWRGHALYTSLLKFTLASEEKK